MIINLYLVKLKSRKKMEKTLKDEELGWWIDICPGRVLKLRDAMESDVKRCSLNEGSSKDPNDYYCELSSHGSLVNKKAVDEILYTVSVDFDLNKIEDLATIVNSVV